jgi:hypothetical protein
LAVLTDSGTPHHSPAKAPLMQERGYRYYDIVLGGFVAVLLCSNLIGAEKTGLLSLPFGLALSFGAGNLFPPDHFDVGTDFTPCSLD